MPFVTGDGILETVGAGASTGTITLLGAVSGYRAMSAVATANGDTFYYSLRGGTEWEVGLGTRASATTFTRTTVLASSNAGALTNFTNVLEFWMDIPARVMLNVQTLTNELTGLKLSNNVSDPTNDIDIASGAAADSTNRDMIRHDPTSTFTKRLDGGIWSVGSGAPGSDTATLLADNIWYVYLIKRLVPGGPDVVDALFSANALVPALPTNYTLYRRIGAVIRSGSTILPFTQDGDYFWLTTVSENLDGSLDSARQLITMTCPPNKMVLFRATVFDTLDWWAVFQRVAETNGAPIDTAPPGVSLIGNSSQSSAGEFAILTNASSQIAGRSAGSGAADHCGIWTRGWIDWRGKNGEG